MTASIGWLERTKIPRRMNVGLQLGQYEPLQDLGDYHEVCDRAVSRRVMLVRSRLLQQRDQMSQLETGRKTAGGERQVGQVSQRRGEDVRTLLQDHRGDGIEWRCLALHGSDDSEHHVCRNRLKLVKPWHVEEWNIDECPTEGGQPGGDVRSDLTQFTNKEVFEAGTEIRFSPGSTESLLSPSLQCSSSLVMFQIDFWSPAASMRRALWAREESMIDRFAALVASRYLFLSSSEVVKGWAGDQMVAGSIPESTNFLTNSSGQATNALVSLFTKH